MRYSGDEADATIAIFGSILLTITFGATTEMLQIKATEAIFLANDGYSVQDVADCIDARLGWEATVLDDSRAAWSLGGVETSLYTDAVAGDFTLRGELASQPVPALLRHANGRRKRGELPAKGAVAA